MTIANGKYEFQNLRPGIHALELDAAKLPPSFHYPEQTVREVKIEPLLGFFLDMPVAAQHAAAGIIFVDKNFDGKYNPQTGEVVEGALIT